MVRVTHVDFSLAAVGGPSDKYAMAAEESCEDRQKRLKEAEKKRRAEKRSKRFKKFWQMFGADSASFPTGSDVQVASS